MKARLDSWGRLDKAEHDVAGLAEFSAGAATSFLAYGAGRSYGDSCHNREGRLLPMQAGAAISSFDTATGLLTADAGVTLSTILARVMPEGYFLEVTPGTAAVTLGGAIANDVHGKNHHRRGTFGRTVVSFELMTSDGKRRTCSPGENAALFATTIGGMGMTGVITSATIRLMRVPSANVRQTAFRMKDIDAFFDAVAEHDAAHEYAVAWIDQLAGGRNLGRGVLMAGDHADDGGVVLPPAPPRLSVPFSPPVNLLNRLTLTAFNEAYFRKAPASPKESLVPWRSYFYPLDAIAGWNRLYGPRGLYQHQSVFPEETARRTVIRLLECARAHGAASFLTVLKRFGDVPSPGLLSFPRPGFTLTLDFANSGERTLRLLDALDEMVLAEGGAINPYKDARMTPETFAASFPRWRELDALRDPAIVSDFWRRTALKLAGTPVAARRTAA